MRPEHWKRVTELFEAAVEREPAARADFLARAAAGDPTLAEEVLRLLACDEKAGTFMNAPPGLGSSSISDRHLAGWQEALRKENPSLATHLQALLKSQHALGEGEFPQTQPAGPPTPAAMIGQKVGSYTLEASIGQGGMGTVWVARRSDGRFEGRAAVKFLNVAFLGGTGEERFKREGSILARLSHPNIAHLFDAGVSPDGQPYLILEYVDGKNIDAYCNEHALDLESRIHLFLDVLAAVAHAHANLIVHRDIKPSNVLAAGDGQVKLLDFGIAKLLEAEAPEIAAKLTHQGERALTPAYAAPEQITGGAITTGTDVYALGVLLYLLLSGKHPAESMLHSPADLMKAIVDTQPERPSDALGPANRLSRSLRGDLDTIIAKALKKNPVDRYPSVIVFADDLRRYLTHQPIGARPDTVAYRARKFVRRHKVGVVATAAIAVVLVVATIVSTKLMLEARRQRDEAQFQTRRAQASSDFMRYLVTQIGSTPMTMKEVLDRGRVALEQQYGADQAFVARMLLQLSGPYIDLGEFATSAEMVTRAIEIGTKLDDADFLAKAHCGAGFDSAYKGDLAAARMHLAEAARQAGRVNTSPMGNLVDCEIGETMLAQVEHRGEDAVGHAERAVEFVEKAGNTSSTRYTTVLSNAANTYHVVGKYRQSLLTQHKATEVYKRIGRGRTINMVVSLTNEGGTQYDLGWWLAAERTISEAVEIAQGLNRSGQLPAFLSVNYAGALISLGRSTKGAELFRQVLEQKNVAPRFVEVAQHGFAAVLLDQGDIAGARALFERTQLKAPTFSPSDDLAVLRAPCQARAS